MSHITSHPSMSNAQHDVRGSSSSIQQAQHAHQQQQQQWNYYQQQAGVPAYPRQGGQYHNAPGGQQPQGWSNYMQYQQKPNIQNPARSGARNSAGNSTNMEKSIMKHNQNITPMVQTPTMQPTPLNIPPSPPRKKPTRTRWSARLKPLVLPKTEAQHDAQPNLPTSELKTNAQQGTTVANNQNKSKSRWGTKVEAVDTPTLVPTKTPPTVIKARSLPPGDLSTALAGTRQSRNKSVQPHVKPEKKPVTKRHPSSKLPSKKEPTRITPKKEPTRITPKKEPTRITQKKPEPPPKVIKPLPKESASPPKKDSPEKTTTTANGITWPESLITYVEQTLSKCPEKLRQPTEAHLKKKIETAMKNGTLNTIKWEVEPLAFMDVRQIQEVRKPVVVSRPAQQRGRGMPQHKKSSQPEQHVEQNEWNQDPRNKFNKRNKNNNQWSQGYGGRQGQGQGQKKFQKVQKFGKNEEHTAGYTIKKKQLKVKQKKKQKVKPEFETVVDSAETSKRKDRAQRFVKTLSNNISDNQPKNKQYDHYGKMKERAYGSTTPASGKKRSRGGMWGGAAVVGVCQKLEKQYLRLTSAPDPSIVRPEYILKKTFDMLMKKWKSNPNYKYTCEQFKSMRQDLTVQHLKNAFTVNVYETHGKIALTVGDLSEFNQCQTQLLQLYDIEQTFRKNFFEFTLYRMLYYLVTDNASSLYSMLKDLHPETRQQEAVQYGLEIRNAVVSKNWCQFFKIYKNAPHNGTLLTTKILPGMRFRALERIARAYKPGKLEVTSMKKMLALDTLKETETYIMERGGKLDPTKAFFLTKGSQIHRPVPKDEANLEKEKDDKLGITHGAFIYT